jgi:hypothetical protein
MASKRAMASIGAATATSRARTARSLSSVDDWFFPHDDGNHMFAHASLTKLGIEFATLNVLNECVV